MPKPKDAPAGTKAYTVRNEAGEILLDTNSIERARRLLAKLRGTIYVQYEAEGIKRMMDDIR